MLKAKVTMAGFFRLEARKASGERRVMADWFPNLITDNGLNLCTTQSAEFWNSSGGMAYAVCVGSGSSTPDPADVALDSLIATKSSPDSVVDGVETTERYFYSRHTWEFPQGAAAGNISEIGVGPVNNNLFSRALVLDSSGNPTTITVLADEFLHVTYELRINQPTVDIINTVDGHDTVLRISRANQTGTFGWSGRAFRLVMLDNYQGVSNETITSITGNLNPITADNLNISNNSYTPGSYTRSGQFILQPAEANIVINSVQFVFGPAYWQFSVSPSINKDNTERLTIGVSMTWAREGELPS